jgi:glycine/D-amino acid oxidase-like deaminating enzyme
MSALMAMSRRPTGMRTTSSNNKRRRRAPPVARAADADAPASFAVLGAGLAGLATAYHLADLAPPGSRVVVFDAKGIGAGGSGAAAGLLHAVSPRGRPLWRAGDAMRAAALAVTAAESAAAAGEAPALAWRTGMLKPAADLRQARDYSRAAAAAVAAAEEEEEEAGGPWLGGSPPRALATAGEARALLPGVAARDFNGEEDEEEEEDPQDLEQLSAADAERRERQRRKQRRRQQRQRQQRQSLVGQGGGGASASAEAASALLIPSGVTLHPGLYMQSLWRACQDLAASKGGRAEMRVGESFASVAELLRRGEEQEGGRWRGVVVAAGAAVGALPEARNAGLAAALALSRGWSLDLAWEPCVSSEASSSSPYPSSAPSLLGKPYLASRGGRELVVGAAGPREGAPPPTAEGVLAALAEDEEEEAQKEEEEEEEDEDKARATRELLEGGARAWPPLTPRDDDSSGGRWRVARVREGVRAGAPRTSDGAPPLLGRLLPLPSSSASSSSSSSPPPPEVWVVAGLGARGLVYHAWLGEMAARGVVERTESHVPAELLRWRIKT